MSLLRSGPLYLLCSSCGPWLCCSPLVNVSLWQEADGNSFLTVQTAGGDMLHSLPVSSMSVKECAAGWCRWKVIRLEEREGKEQVLLWGEREDREGWMADLRNCQEGRETGGDERSLSIDINSRAYNGVDSPTDVISEDRSKADGENFSTAIDVVTADNMNRKLTDVVTSADALFETSANNVDSRADNVDSTVACVENEAGTADNSKSPSPTSLDPSWLSILPRLVRMELDMVNFNYDEMYAELQPMVTNVDRSKTQMVLSVVKQLISTMNPSKVRLPACIVECRSLLESYADAFGRPELLNTIPKGKTEMERLEKVTSFYLSQLKCMRPVSCVSKPYNPVQGEIFICSWPEAECGTVHFIAEQISHHPPISAFHLQCSEATISLTCNIFTKSGLKTSFLPPFLKAMTVDNVGHARLHLHTHSEVYTMTFPTAVATGILGSNPRLLLTGKVNIACSSHPGRVEMDFEGESFVSGTVFGGDSLPVGRVEGDWREMVEIVREEGERMVLLDMKDWVKPRVKKVVPPVAKQVDLESRRLWRFLTRAMGGFSTEIDADTAKRRVEDWAKNMEEDVASWQPQFFVIDKQNPVNVQFKLSID